MVTEKSLSSALLQYRRTNRLRDADMMRAFDLSRQQWDRLISRDRASADVALRLLKDERLQCAD